MSIISNQLAIGIVAHVDSGKTTLAESILYETGSIRRWGRVDHGDAFLDTYALEKARGITIFSKQAEFDLGDRHVTLLDTPGHVDFSAEMERTLQVLDAAILVISGSDGVQGHVTTLWRLLKRYHIPTFLFVNKMDQDGTDKEKILEELQARLDQHCVDFTDLQDPDTQENLAVCDDELLERFFEEGEVGEEDIRHLVSGRKVFPCYFGSALKREGVKEFLEGIARYAAAPVYGEEFGARVYKIARDPQGNRLTYMKITGGSLKVKMQLTNRRDENTAEPVDFWEEKADQIRIYSGASFRAVNEVEAGTVCAVTGLTKTYSGQGLGVEDGAVVPVLEPVLTYQIILPEGCDVHGIYTKLCQLEEEEPQLHVVWNERLQEIHAQIMGEVQLEILKSMIVERYGVSVEFGAGSIVYKETIAAPVEGVGHFEPLRHYAEVHLLLEPGEPGSGMEFGTDCSEDILDKNWQRLILTHLEEKAHLGVLTGSEITDMRITLVTGRAHVKHTEGGDFRQATYRAVRQGLRQADSILLEPVYEFRLEIPADRVGRAMTDIQKMQGTFSTPEMEGDMAVITGKAPVATMGGYQTEVTAYTRGAGHLFCALKGYEPCHNAEEVIEAMGYDPEGDLENPTGSVFCAHGAGFVVDWCDVPDYMHLDSGLGLLKKNEAYELPELTPTQAARSRAEAAGMDEDELEAIFSRTYGPVKEKRIGQQGGDRMRPVTKTVSRVDASGRPTAAYRKMAESGASVSDADPSAGGAAMAAGYKNNRRSGAKPRDDKEYFLVDGYNIIFAWDELKELAAVNIEASRNLLMDILSNYQGYKKNVLILVFDAYKVKGNVGEVSRYNDIYVVYTKEAETADQYIEKTVHEIGRRYPVTVATSDALEQLIIMGQGATRMSAAGLKEEIESAGSQIREMCRQRRESAKNYLFDHLPEDLAIFMEEVRLGRKQLTDRQIDGNSDSGKK